MARTFKGYIPIEAPTFDLESPDGQRRLTVQCVGMLPGTRFLDFMSLAGGGRKNGDDDDGDASAGAAMAEGIHALFRAAVREDNYEAFQAFIDDPQNGIDMETLGEIAGYLGETFARRPTAPSVPSSAG